MQKLHILYEHPTWFQGLFWLLEHRGIDYQKLDLSQNQLDPLSFPGDAVLFNRVGARPSENAETVVRDLKEFLAVLELRGVEVINGSRSYDIATSKLRQQAIFESLGLCVPQTVVTRECSSVEGLPFPVLVKPNVGGSGEGKRIYYDLNPLSNFTPQASTFLGKDPNEILLNYLLKRNTE